MERYDDICLAADDIYLPAAGVDMNKWAVVACDQYTSQPEHWRETASIVGDAPSTLRMIYPEAFLGEEGGDMRISAINAAMAEYLSAGVIVPAVHGFILVERECSHGMRVGLVAVVDLEKYDFSVGSKSPIRATEGTVLDRIPPRVKIREHASVELPHIMMLIDDKARTVLEPLYEMRDSLRDVYDFDLMQGGGHIRGWAVEGEAADFVIGALRTLRSECSDIFLAVGDGNHSLATARQCWLNIRDALTPEEREAHPARYALCEIVNLHSDALVFEPVHRIIKGADMGALIRDLGAWCERGGMRMARGAREGHVLRFINAQSDMSITISDSRQALEVGTLQTFLDEWIRLHPEATIDYIHGEDAIRQLCAQPDTCGILLKPMDKSQLFPAVEQGGSLPRKTFSMGEAHEKRFYLECRKITMG